MNGRIETLDELKDVFSRCSFSDYKPSKFMALSWGVIKRLRDAGVSPGKIDDVLVNSGVKSKGNLSRYVERGKSMNPDEFALERYLGMNPDAWVPGKIEGLLADKKTEPSESFVSSNKENFVPPTREEVERLMESTHPTARPIKTGPGATDWETEHPDPFNDSLPDEEHWIVEGRQFSPDGEELNSPYAQDPDDPDGEVAQLEAERLEAERLEAERIKREAREAAKQKAEREAHEAEKQRLEREAREAERQQKEREARDAAREKAEREAREAAKQKAEREARDSEKQEREALEQPKSPWNTDIKPKFVLKRAPKASELEEKTHEKHENHPNQGFDPYTAGKRAGIPEGARKRD